jgi:mRNA-degrading endonuclease RelE of RelBE toxin-antitoxin system
LSYKLAFTKAFIKEFNRLPKNEKERIFEAIKNFQNSRTTAQNFGESLKDFGDGEWANTE